MGVTEKSRDSYICVASAVAVDVCHSGEKVTGRNGLPDCQMPDTSRSRHDSTDCSAISSRS
ncbi:hypothetical protein FRUB_08750 [Fimbriiglobus ruber]|uniref:Uncharacterized protein n=1 Tax=Fimbriiglobus ruber TaxID=1908690 RepID=A0A225DJ77_9BACT|nr:hypothetical protein FRUB_08750 [Fimbriiglobus ruber]